MPDWTIFSFLIGGWHGTGSGQPGSGQYERSYEIILDEQFIYVRNKSIYPPQAKNPQGEVHEDWGFISYDKLRRTYLLRQFHAEGFVNQYLLESVSGDSRMLVFTSESIENIQPGWRAKETWRLISPDVFNETFELAAPGKEYEVYTECTLSRKNDTNA